jgi:hypothetical protein
MDQLNPDATFNDALSLLDEKEAAKLRASIAASDAQKSLDRLFDYTKFHIGLYLTLTASYVAVTSMKNGSVSLLNVDKIWFRCAVVCFMLAGLAGGVIASSITQTGCRSTKSFLAERIGPWNTTIFEARTWTWIEHTSFWIGLVLALMSVHPADVNNSN